MDPLQYCAQRLGYILGVKPFSREEEHRIDLIKDINAIQIKLKKGALTPKDFDRLWDSPIQLLIDTVNDQSALLFPPLHTL